MLHHDLPPGNLVMEPLAGDTWANHAACLFHICHLAPHHAWNALACGPLVDFTVMPVRTRHRVPPVLVA